ncbi:hypothetical protein GH714_036119 [Hevea brasiliensis]|uniref:BED-type domain-containing protein n=1 Tax=Hevea brasiliensis TaxID=3981 RepID=A0A6A6KM94_HEVBR|nr:hypothetical protein GH714_036119 [Hevea brasiliensis]
MPRSTVWDHFTKFKTDNGDTKGKCNYCNKEFCCDPKRNGTTALRNHMNTCKKHPHAIETRQALLDLQPNSNNVEGEVGTLTTWKYDENAIREALVSMIIIDELTFKFVEGEGFRKFMRAICPKFKIPSRWTISRDCYLVHKGDAIGRAIETCLLEWGLDKIFTITVDNASSNDIAISYLKKKLANWGVTVSNSDYLHMRCMAHIVNLVVMDGLKDVGESVLKVRNAVRYIRSSPARLKKFKECVEYEKIDGKSSLCLDVPTRWNSTYLMLNIAQKYERVFERYESQEPMFRLELGENGVPDFHDWSECRKMAEMLSHFYELTLRISGSRYITSNMFFGEISDLAFILNQWVNSTNVEVKNMGDKMKKKFDKYWGDIDKMNKLIYFATVLDPRDKFEYMEFQFCQMHGEEKGEQLFQKVKSSLIDLFNEYKMYQTDCEQISDNTSSQLSSGSGSIINLKPKLYLKHHYKKQKSSLTPRIVEALICAQDWTRSSNCPINVEEDLEELEKFEEVLPSVGLTQLGGSSCSTPTLNS